MLKKNENTFIERRLSVGIMGMCVVLFGIAHLEFFKNSGYLGQWGNCTAWWNAAG